MGTMKRKRKTPIPIPQQYQMPGTGGMMAHQGDATAGTAAGMLIGGGIGAGLSYFAPPAAPYLITGGAAVGGLLGNAFAGAEGIEAEARYAADVAAMDRQQAQMQWEYMMAKHDEEYADAQRNWHMNQVSQYHTPDPSRFNTPWGPTGGR